MINRLEIAWPDQRAFDGRGGRPIRFLVASDDPDPALRHAVNREALGQLDGILGCGDLEPEWLDFLAESFHTPLVYVRGNHDRDGQWRERPLIVPAWLDAVQSQVRPLLELRGKGEGICDVRGYHTMVVVETEGWPYDVVACEDCQHATQVERDD